ncbi:MAG: NIL domain-containing protein, partial [Fusobacterium sp.]
ETLVGDRGVRLSGGQAQRLTIARAFLQQSPIYLFDEATSALDPKTTKSILQLIRNIQNKLGLTVVMITHQMEVIRDICNKVAVMSHGEIVETGGVHHIFSNPKTETTKELISYLPNNEESTADLMKTKGKMLIKLNFLGSISKDPIISRAIKKFNVDFSIIGGSIESLSTMRVGHLYVELSGDFEEQKLIIPWLTEEGVIVEVVYNGL